MEHVVIDEGSAQAKGVWFSEGKINKAIIKSLLIEDAKFEGIKGYSDSAYRLDNDLVYTVDKTAIGAIRTTSDYQVSDYNLAIVHELLRQNGFGGKEICLHVTLPVKDFFNMTGTGSAFNDDLIQSKRNNLMREINNINGEPLANIVNVKVYPEAIPAWFDYLIDDEGNKALDVDATNKIMVVDIGGTTADLAIINGVGGMDRQGTIKQGVYKIADNLQKKLDSKYEHGSLEKYQLDDAMRVKQFFGDDISKEIDQACLPVEKRILGEMKEFLEQPKNVDAVLYVGGGSALMGEYLAKEYGGQTIIGDEYSIARGILKQLIANGVVA